MVSKGVIQDRLSQELFGQRLLDNSMRGFWCEAMVAEAIGPTCKIVSSGWHAWDLQIGNDTDQYPDRIRIQVKNSARTQSWNVASKKLSKCEFNLSYRRKPFYFDHNSPGIPCEKEGFLCEVFVLCYHDVEDFQTADHQDPAQWKFFIIPVVGPSPGVTTSEIEWASKKLLEKNKPVSCVRRPETLQSGIRSRPRIQPVKIEVLTMGAINRALGILTP